MRTRLLLLFLACLPLGATAEGPLGKLFHSAQERELLDKQRRGENIATPDGQPAPVERKPVVTGYVKRSDGKSTVFLDRRPYRTADPVLQDRLNHRMIERYVEPAAAPAPQPPAAKPASPARAPGES